MTRNNTDELLEERGKTHGDYTCQAGTSDAITKVMEKTPNWKTLDPPQRDALRMIAVKISRMLNGDAWEVDHFKDIIGYATLALNYLERDHK